MMRIILVGYLVCVGFIVLGETRTENNFDGANAICWKVEEFHAQEPVNNTKTVKMRSQSWCFSIPPRCTTYKEESIFVVQIQNVTKTRTKSFCCDGYIQVNGSQNATTINGQYKNEDDENGRHNMPRIVCKPICKNNEDACQKDPCDSKHWGENCEKFCNCTNGGLCHRTSGECICGRGWIGDSCEKSCSSGYYGLKCLKQCKCISNKCNHITGVCISTHNGQNATAHTISMPTDSQKQRIKVEHWIPIVGNGVAHRKNCLNETSSDCTRLQSHDMRNENSSSIIIKSLNSSIVNLADNIGKLSKRVNEQQRQLELADKKRLRATETFMVDENSPEPSTAAVAILVDSSILSTTISSQQSNVIAVVSDTIERIDNHHTPLTEQQILIETHANAEMISKGNQINANDNAAPTANERIVHVITGIELSKNLPNVVGSPNTTETEMHQAGNQMLWPILEFSLFIVLLAFAVLGVVLLMKKKDHPPRRTSKPNFQRNARPSIPPSTNIRRKLPEIPQFTRSFERPSKHRIEGTRAHSMTASSTSDSNAHTNDLHARVTPNKFIYNYTSANEIYGDFDLQISGQMNRTDNKLNNENIYDEINYPVCKTNEKTMA